MNVKAMCVESKQKSKEGFLLFYVMGTIAVLGLAALIAVNSSTLESRTARNHLDTVRALYHAEAGVKLVKREVENRLMGGETLTEILATLSVAAPEGVEFDTIDTFQETVPGRLFGFESVGRSGEAMASVVVQFRRRPLLQAGLFGVESVNSDPSVLIFGYDSRVLTNPTPSDSNGGASVGSNGAVNLQNHNFIDGMILLGETETGVVAGCSRCTLFTQVFVGHQDPDPLGLTNGGTMAEVFEDAMVSNNNAAVPQIAGNRINTAGEVVLTAGDYYLTSAYFGPGSNLIVDDSAGAVRIFLDGPLTLQPNADISVATEKPFGFQIYSRSSHGIFFRPNGDTVSFIYAPLSTITIWPNNDARGAFWADVVEMKPGGELYLDTSLAEKMLMNNLEIHAWYEQHIN